MQLRYLQQFVLPQKKCVLKKHTHTYGTRIKVEKGDCWCGEKISDVRAMQYCFCTTLSTLEDSITIGIKVNEWAIQGNFLFHSFYFF